MEKLCTKCKVIKNIDQFHFHKVKNKLQSHCKICNKSYVRPYITKRKESLMNVIIPNLFEEIWKGIKDYEDLYEISNFGRIKRIQKLSTNGHIVPNKILKNVFDSRGYPYISLLKNNIRSRCAIHRAVAEAFIPNPENKPEVNHINGIKTDYRIENLEWCTHQENIQHAFRTGLIKSNKWKQ